MQIRGLLQFAKGDRLSRFANQVADVRLSFSKLNTICIARARAADEDQFILDTFSGLFIDYCGLITSDYLIQERTRAFYQACGSVNK